MSEPSAARVYNVLFLCTGNTARSILAEALLKRLGAGKFRAFSAGSHPKGMVNPHAIDLLQSSGHDVSDLRSKSWDEFAMPGATEMDFVITVCDTAAGEACPFWPGQPMLAHWGIPDPAAVDGQPYEIDQAFSEAYRMLRRRIEVFVALPLSKIDKLVLRTRLAEIHGDAKKADVADKAP